ncbi:coiled-coil domain-containing protein 180 [Enterobacter quasiroggenkampii]|uniref:coiled-coil domain-containing protein 180 n=1 Tax=Enterobacter quasiroggenkampii TaxID=2497436 RepID=UPI0021D30008|nr:coiled-coil domain-containing protein 180 [Enterobacter quasiroggenkampii]MCU6324394.1 coiled-coil domain-containing protein 180 [Enterobacter quasiroggenkampii]
MDNDIIELWEKIEQHSVNDKEKSINDFLKKFTLTEFWVECEEYGEKLGFVLNEATEDDLKSLLFVYPVDGEEPPDMLTNAINKGGGKFHKFDGASLLGILHGIGCSLMIVSSARKFVCIKKDIINKFYIALTGNVNSGNSTGGIPKKWFWVGVAAIVLLCILGGRFYQKNYSQVSITNLSEISWRTVKIDIAKGNFSVDLPFNYETDSWKKDLSYELQSGNVFRVYKSNDAVFRNHIINIGFIPSGTSLSESMTDLNAETSLILSAMQKKLGEIKITSRGYVDINSNDMVMVKGNMKVKGDDARLTTVVALTGMGVMWIQVISARGDSEEHDFFANKIINSVEIMK